MTSIEFQTTIKKIISAVPKEKRGDLGSRTGDEEVHVIVHTTPFQQPQKHKDLLQDAKEKGYDDFLEYLMDYPLEIVNPIRFTREELHER
jgi:hypothetical protein